MVAEGHVILGPNKNDNILYLRASGTGVSFPTTTDDSVAPPQTDRWLKVIDTADANNDVGEGETIPVTSIHWVGVRAYRFRGSLTSGQVVLLLRVFSSVDVVLGLAIVYETASTFKWRLLKTTSDTEIATGSGVYNNNTTYSLRMEQSLAGRVKLWVDSALEIDAAQTGRFNRNSIRFQPTLSSGQQHYFSGIIAATGGSNASRIDHKDIEVHTVVEDGDWATEQDYGDETVCDSADGVAADVALDGSDSVNTSIFWCRLGAHAGEQMVEGTAVTIGAGKDIVAVAGYGSHKAFASAKTVEVYHRLHDGTDVTEYELRNISATTFGMRGSIFTDAPDGNPWEQADVNAIKFGIRTVDTNESNDHCGAMILEVGACSTDPPTGRSTVMIVG